MPITADMVRELAARGERSTLDFKREDYDWSDKKAANAELAKDLMAIANVLGPGSAPGHIMIGVENTGMIVGIPAGSHLDDASLHQKVRDLLNRTPRFVYGPVEVDGMSVGVYEIVAGDRPFFPLSQQGKLQRHVAVYRDGTATETVSPQMVLDWDRADDPARHAMLAHELRRIAADAAVHARIVVQNMATDGNGMEVTLAITNAGRSGFFIESIEWRAEWQPDFFEAITAAGGAAVLPDGYVAPHGPVAVTETGRVPPTFTATITFRYTRAQALEHFKQTALAVAGFNGRWAEYHFEVRCRGELGGHEVLRASAK